MPRYFVYKYSKGYLVKYTDKNYWHTKLAPISIRNNKLKVISWAKSLAKKNNGEYIGYKNKL